MFRRGRVFCICTYVYRIGCSIPYKLYLKSQSIRFYIAVHCLPWPIAECSIKHRFVSAILVRQHRGKFLVTSLCTEASSCTWNRIRSMGKKRPTKSHRWERSNTIIWWPCAFSFALLWMKHDVVCRTSRMLCSEPRIVTSCQIGDSQGVCNKYSELSRKPCRGYHTSCFSDWITLTFKILFFEMKCSLLRIVLALYLPPACSRVLYV